MALDVAQRGKAVGTGHGVKQTRRCICHGRKPLMPSQPSLRGHGWCVSTVWGSIPVRVLLLLGKNLIPLHLVNNLAPGRLRHCR